MKFLTRLQPVLPQENLREKGSVGKRHHSSFQKGLGRVVTTKCSKVMAQNVKQGLAWIWCRFWKHENSVTWSTPLGNIFWSFFIYKVIYTTNESWKYLVFTQIQQYIPPWNKFLHITKTMFFVYFLSVFLRYRHPFWPPYLRSNNYLQLLRENVLGSIMLLCGCIVLYTAWKVSVFGVTLPLFIKVKV